MNITPQTHYHLLIEFTEAEARTFLVDPAPVQAQVRASLAELHQLRNPQGRARTGGKGIRLGLQAQSAEVETPAPKAHRPAPSAAREKIKCAQCGQMIARYQMPKHTRSCRATASAAGSSA